MYDQSRCFLDVRKVNQCTMETLVGGWLVVGIGKRFTNSIVDAIVQVPFSVFRTLTITGLGFMEDWFTS